MTFLIAEDNGGRHHWTLIADGGEPLMRSAGFDSYQHAKQAASIVQLGASRASLDEGGNFKSEALTR
jgi:uncharacterized protein YegP (UPF0339 family)